MNKGLILGTLAVAILAMKSKKKVKVSGDATTPLTDYNLINNIAYSGATSVNGAFPADMAGGYVNPSFDNAIPNSAFAVYRDNSDIFTDKLNLLDGSKYSGAKSLYGVSADEIGNVMQYLDQRFKTEGKNIKVTPQQAYFAILANTQPANTSEVLASNAELLKASLSNARTKAK